MVARYPRGFVAAMVTLALVFWMGMGATVLLAHQVLDGIPDREMLSRVTHMARSSVFYDHKGQPAFTISKEQRFEVPLDRISPHLRDAILAIEDQRFYDHRGIDLVRVGGAALSNVRQGRRAEGASTITQQLARRSFLTFEKTYTRKLQEVVLAALLERQFTKDQILELYLNKAYFGNGLYGAEAAALGYFGKPAAELEVHEAALLAGLVKAPSSFAPTVDVDRAVGRRAVVLNQMRAMGVIDEDTWARARETEVVLDDALRREEPYGRYFKEHVRRELIARFGEERVYEGGLRVYTTIDLDMQRAAEAEVQRVLADLERRRRAKPGEETGPLQAAVFAMDPHTGQVRAMVGGRDFDESKFNRAVQARRQAGSAFKPFVYAAALEAGSTPASLITNLNKPIATPQGAWIPEDEQSSADAMTMRAALRTSSNRAAVRAIEDVGIAKAVDYAERLGVVNIPRVPSAALGAGEVTLESLTAAFAVFASEGVRRQPVYVTHVEDADGELIYVAPSDAEQVVSPHTAFLITQMMTDVIDHGTAWRARQLGFKLPAAGKTGTTNEYRDSWFVGYTPRLVTGVWVGFDQPQTIMVRGYASEVAVPLWAGFMRKATDGHKPDWYKAPQGIVTASICRLSGRRPSEGCAHSVVQAADGSVRTVSSVYTEYFVRGTVPSETCPLHVYRAPVETRIASADGNAVVAAPAPAPARDTAAPAAGSASAPAQTAQRGERAEAAVEAPQKKRGFWSRVFGRGGNDRDNRQQQQPQRPREPRDR